MKILQKGNGEYWKLKIECMVTKDENGLSWDADKEHCHSILEIDKNDIMTKEWSKYGGLSGIDYIVKCPVCGSILFIEEDKIPEWIKKLAKQRAKENNNEQ